MNPRGALLRLTPLAAAGCLLVSCGGDSDKGAAPLDANTGPDETTDPEASVPTREPAWATLRRPLDLPSGTPCRRTRARSVNRDVGLAAGRGPLYPVFGYPESPPAPSAVVPYTNEGEGIRRKGWWYTKVLWTRRPGYSGRVLVRGQKLGGGPKLRFQRGGESAPLTEELRFPAVKPGTDEWIHDIGSLLIRSRGCYGLQIDGQAFSRVVVFKAVP